jgi:hypothetical protein
MTIHKPLIEISPDQELLLFRSGLNCEDLFRQWVRFTPEAENQLLADHFIF